MKKIGLKTPPSGTAETMEQAMEIADQIGNFPLIIRPAFTLGGSGGGIAYNVEEFHQIIESGLQASVTTQACSRPFILYQHVRIGSRCVQADIDRHGCTHACRCIACSVIFYMARLGVASAPSATTGL